MKSVKDYTKEELEWMMFSALEEVEEKIKSFYGRTYGRKKHERYKDRMDKVRLKINNRLRSVAGRYCCRYSSIDGEKTIQDVRIELHPELKGESEIYDTLKHEALHLISGESDNSIFRSLCDRFDISAYHSQSFSTKERIQYKIYCSSCKELIARRKRKSKIVKKPEVYHSRCCKASLAVEEV